MEGPFAAAPHCGVDPEVDLVGQSISDEFVGQFAAAEGDQVPAVPALEARHALGEVAPDQRRVPVQGLLQGPGGDVLGDAVHPLGEAGVVGDGGPNAGEALVDLAPEEEGVRGQELIELVPFALALEDAPVPGRWPDHAIDGDVGGDDHLPQWDLHTRTASRVPAYAGRYAARSFEWLPRIVRNRRPEYASSVPTMPGSVPWARASQGDPSELGELPSNRWLVSFVDARRALRRPLPRGGRRHSRDLERAGPGCPLGHRPQS